ncbi:MAG: radical SAM protein [Longimicrobiales bacterium]
MGMSFDGKTTPEGPIHDGAADLAPGTTFGPVPSRRFGRSLGINNIPPKVCTYACVYCQVGQTVQMRRERRAFYDARGIAAAVRGRVDAARRAGEQVDHLSFVPDGEPTLDQDLLAVIRLLRPLEIPIAVITNGSLLFLPDVRAALSAADRVSVKVDAVREGAWRKINRPHRHLELPMVLEGMRAFAESFEGVLTTETMLVDGVNDAEDELRATAAFVGELAPHTAYLAVPTRPPAEAWAVPPDAEGVARAYEIFRAFHPRVELLMGYEGDAFASTGDPVADLLSITAVHPMREVAVQRLLARGGVPWPVVGDLMEDGRIVQVAYGPHRYYMRPVARRPHERST